MVLAVKDGAFFQLKYWLAVSVLLNFSDVGFAQASSKTITDATQTREPEMNSPYTTHKASFSSTVAKDDTQDPDTDDSVVVPLLYGAIGAGGVALIIIVLVVVVIVLAVRLKRHRSPSSDTNSRISEPAYMDAESSRIQSGCQNEYQTLRVDEIGVMSVYSMSLKTSQRSGRTALPENNDAIYENAPYESRPGP